MTGKMISKRFFLLGCVLSPALAGCAADRNFAMSCTEYVGQPVSYLTARQGPPESTVRIDATRMGYVYTATQRAYTQSKPYYEVNYMVNVVNKRSVSRPVTVTCSGMYIVFSEPGGKQLVVDVWPVR